MSDAPNHEWEELARAASGDADSEQPSEAERQLLSFRLDGAAYALPVERTREIVRVRPATPIPRVPEEVLGAISLRGEIVQVLDLRRRLGLPSAAPSRASRIVVVFWESGLAGLLVDSVTEVLRVPERDLRPPGPGEAAAVEALCTSGDGGFVSVIDLERVLQVDVGS